MKVRDTFHDAELTIKDAYDIITEMIRAGFPPELVQEQADCYTLQGKYEKFGGMDITIEYGSEAK